MGDQRTSRGYAAEMLEVIANLLAATEHLHDIPEQTKEVLDLIWQTRENRNRALDILAPKENVNMDYHCYFKHILTAYIQSKELLQSALAGGDELKIGLHLNLCEIMKDNLLVATSKYLGIEITDDTCWKCIEDRIQDIK